MTPRTISTPRLTTSVRFSGPEDGIPVLFVHGNLSGGTWWEEVMAALPAGYRGTAPDLRGYGGADPAALIDATRGAGDFSDDLVALMDHLGIDAAHMVGHSLGGGVLWRVLADHPGRVLSLTQVAPSSPFGFGATLADGTSCFADGAGSGGGAVNPDFAQRLAAGDRTAEAETSPRTILNTFVWKPPFVPERIEEILETALAQHTGETAYPGDMAQSENWPGVAPGKYGPVNALAPIHQTDPLGFVAAEPKPPILWIRGEDDPIVADESLFDLGTLGKLGAVPGWPGEDVFPPQPMVAQTRSALAAYRDAGGTVDEVAIPDCGHSPFLEKPGAFTEAFHGFLARVAG